MTEPQIPLPIGLTLLQPKKRQVSAATIGSLTELIKEAEDGRLIGFAVACVFVNNGYSLRLCGDATNQNTQIAVVGMLEMLKKMVIDLHA